MLGSERANEYVVPGLGFTDAYAMQQVENLEAIRTGSSLWSIALSTITPTTVVQMLKPNSCPKMVLEYLKTAIGHHR